ncbi:MAG: phosphatase PAP2 family protein [Proteobacteria bacterium]|nr:phosphatase PAP2 family protein [Pseudomonadota bacterium]
MTRLPGPRWVLALAVGATLVTALAIGFVDRPLARWTAQYQPLAIWDRGIEGLEWTVGLPVWRFLSTAVVVIAMLATMIVPRWRRHAAGAILFAGTHVIGKYATNELKDVTGRLRPSEWLAYEKHYPDMRTFFIPEGISFPSGHVAIFATLLVPLAIVVPRARPLAAIVIAFVMAARLAVNAHFLSDVTGGVALTALLAYVIRIATTTTTTPPAPSRG